MQAIATNLADSARSVLTSVPPILLFMAGGVAAFSWIGLQLLAMIADK
tara:strand:- start:15325 stop:15468 length:144 start_codon:yes stop_codon:yes gene_type:complete